MKPRKAATVGVAEHGNSAELVTLGPGDELLDRRRIDLTTGLPTHPYHHEGSWAVGRYLDSPWAKPTTRAEALSLIARVRVAAAEGATAHLEALAATITLPITKIGIRVCPALPATAAQIIEDTRAATMADSILYREALAVAAEARGWKVCWYDRDRVFADTGRKDIDALLAAMGKAIGPPWQARHKLAAAAALAARRHR